MTEDPLSADELKQVIGWLNVDGTRAPRHPSSIPKRLLATIKALTAENAALATKYATACEHLADMEGTIQEYRERAEAAEAEVRKLRHIIEATAKGLDDNGLKGSAAMLRRAPTEIERKES